MVVHGRAQAPLAAVLPVALAIAARPLVEITAQPLIPAGSLDLTNSLEDVGHAAEPFSLAGVGQGVELRLGGGHVGSFDQSAASWFS